MNWRSTGAKFYFDWVDPVTGKRVREIAGISPGEAKDAWATKSKVLAGEVEDDETGQPQPENRTIDNAIEKFLIEVNATKGAATLDAYRDDLRWFEINSHIGDEIPSTFSREEQTLFALGFYQQMSKPRMHNPESVGNQSGNDIEPGTDRTRRWRPVLITG